MYHEVFWFIPESIRFGPIGKAVIIYLAAQTHTFIYEYTVNLLSEYFVVVYLCAIIMQSNGLTWGNEARLYSKVSEC